MSSWSLIDSVYVITHKHVFLRAEIGSGQRLNKKIQRQQLLGWEMSLLASLAVCCFLARLKAATSDTKGSEQLCFLHVSLYVIKVTLNEVHTWVWASPEHFMKQMKSLAAGPQTALKASWILTGAQSGRNIPHWPHHLPHVWDIFLHTHTPSPPCLAD